MDSVTAFFIFGFGAIAGSFLNVCIYRMPRDLSIVAPRSFCPNCKAKIPWYENIPLLSYVLLRGKCFRCKQPISIRYFFMELVTGLIAWMLWRNYGLSAEFAAAAIFFALLLTATMTDFETGLIPHKVTFPGMVSGLALSVTGNGHFLQGLWYQRLLASAGGLLAGAAIIFLMVQAGKFFFGKRRVYLAAHSVVKIKENKLVIEQKPEKDASGECGTQCFLKAVGDLLRRREKLDPSCAEFSWEDLFNRDSDRICFRATSLKILDKTFQDVDVEISEKAIKAGEEDHLLAGAGSVEAVTDCLVIPREAMGFGDLYFLAMIGAFIGAPKVALVFLLAPFPALPLALWQRYVKKEETIPFGPFLALAGALVFVQGDAVLKFIAKLYGVN